MSLSPEFLQFITQYTNAVLNKINRTITRKITTTFQDSDEVIPSSKLVKDEFTIVRGEIPTKTSDLTNDSGFLTQHQDISGKEDKSNKVTSLSNNSTDDEYPSAKAVFQGYNDLSTGLTNISDGLTNTNNILRTHTHGIITSDGKITDQASKNVVTDSNGKITTEEKPTIPTTTSQLTNNGADGTHAFIVEGDSRLTDSRTPKSHTQASSTITDTATYSAINNSAQTQASINSAINDKIQALMNLDIIEQVTERPTASENTLNKIYLVPESSEELEDAFKAYITVHKDNSYVWERIDIARIDLTDYVTEAELTTTLSDVNEDILEAMKNTEPLVITFTGTEFKCLGNVINRYSDSIIIDYGDGTVLVDTDYTGSTSYIGDSSSQWTDLNVVHPKDHTYEESGSHTIKIYNVTDMYGTFKIPDSNNTNNYTMLDTIIFPDSLKTISNGAFERQVLINPIDFKNVEVITNGAFQYCTGITALNIENVKTISGNAFQYCTEITTLNIENVETISNSAFQYCIGITTLNIENVETISNGAFWSCTGIVNLNINNLKYINGVFVGSYCPLENVNINGFITIDGGPFLATNYDGTKVNGNLNFNGNISSLFVTNGEGSYIIDEFLLNKNILNQNNGSIITVGVVNKFIVNTETINRNTYLLSVGSIETLIFRKNCPAKIYSNWTYNASNIILSSTVNDIQSTATSNPMFGNCEKIAFKGTTPPTAGNKTFYGISNSCKIYVPKSALSTYQSATNYPSSVTYIPIPDEILDIEDEVLMIDITDALYNSGFLTQHQDISGKADKSEIPTKTSQLTNDSGFLTQHQNISGKEDTSNKVTSVSSSSTNTQYPSAKAVYDAIPSDTVTLTATLENGTTKTFTIYGNENTGD